MDTRYLNTETARMDEAAHTHLLGIIRELQERIKKLEAQLARYHRKRIKAFNRKTA